MTCCCEHGDEHLSTIKSGDFLDYMNDPAEMSRSVALEQR